MLFKKKIKAKLVKVKIIKSNIKFKLKNVSFFNLKVKAYNKLKIISFKRKTFYKHVKKFLNLVKLLLNTYFNYIIKAYF